MSCEQKSEGNQTEFEFFQQMQANRFVTSCCGPVVEIGFNSDNLSWFSNALEELGLSPDYLDFYDPSVLDSSHMSLTMCSKHWIEHCTAVSGIADKVKNTNWMHLAYYTFRVVCLSNNWDYKEVLNYSKNITSAKS